MEDIVKSFAEKLGIKPAVAKKGLSITYRYFILKSDPVEAGGLLSMLPTSLTNLFSIEEKNKNKTNQKYISSDEVIEEISNECFKSDKQLGKNLYEEAINLLKSKIW